MAISLVALVGCAGKQTPHVSPARGTTTIDFAKCVAEDPNRCPVRTYGNLPIPRRVTGRAIHVRFGLGDHEIGREFECVEGEVRAFTQNELVFVCGPELVEFTVFVQDGKRSDLSFHEGHVADPSFTIFVASGVVEYRTELASECARFDLTYRNAAVRTAKPVVFTPVNQKPITCEF